MKKIITDEMLKVINNMDMSMIIWLVVVAVIWMILFFIIGMKKKKIKVYLKIFDFFEGVFESED